MAKRHKQRVRIGVNESGEPIFKWADGYSIDELNDNIVRIYIENGLLKRFTGKKVEKSSLPENGASTNGTNVCPTFREYTVKWFETYKTPNLKSTTCKGYVSNLEKHLYPFFGDKRLDEITTDCIQQFLNEKASLARSTVHTMFVLFGEVMASACEDKLIPSNPANSKRLVIPSKGKTERDALTPEQIKAIIEGIPA